MGTKLTINATRFFWLKLLVGYGGYDLLDNMEPFFPELHPNPGWHESCNSNDIEILHNISS